MIAGGQCRDERGHASGAGVDCHDARAVVLPIMLMSRLVGVGREQAAALETVLEGKVNGRAFRLESTMRSGLAERSTDPLSPLIKDQHIRSERVCWIKIARTEGRLVVARAWQSVAGLQDKNLEALGVAEKRDTGRSVQAGGEDRYLEARGKLDILAVIGIEERCVLSTKRIRYRCGETQVRKSQQRGSSEDHG